MAVIPDPVGVAKAGPPVFSSEGPSLYAQAFDRNKQFAVKGPYQTKLSNIAEKLFLQWVAQKSVNGKGPGGFDPKAKVSDYDMRGFWLHAPDQQVQSWKPGMHFPDTFKTPYDTSFSAESKYSLPSNPFVWSGNTLIDKRSGFPVFGGS